MRVPAVRPEDEQPVKQRFDAGYHILPFRVDLQHPTLFLPTDRQSIQYKHNAVTQGARKSNTVRYKRFTFKPGAV